MKHRFMDAVWIVAVASMCLLIVEAFKPYKTNDPMLHTLSGELMRNVSRNDCPSVIMKPENIHVVMIASQRYYEGDGILRFHKETVEYYTKSHGYPLHIIDPAKVLDVYGSLKGDNSNGAIIASKSLVMLYAFKEIFHKHGCAAQWVLFIDADVIILDLSRTLESIIATANRLHGGPAHACEFIGQFASSTINSGWLAFRASVNGERALRNWLELHHHNVNRGHTWQDDQGWLQYSYLKYLETHFRRPAFIECAVNFHSVPGLAAANGGRIQINSMRNLCFAKNDYLYGLYERYMFGKSKGGGGSGGSTGGAGGGGGMQYCLLRGTGQDDLVNMRDWNGDHLVDPVSKEYNFGICNGRYFNNGTAVTGACRLTGLFMYHGKDFNFINKHVRGAYARAKELWEQSRGGGGGAGSSSNSSASASNATAAFTAASTSIADKTEQHAKKANAKSKHDARHDTKLATHQLPTSGALDAQYPSIHLFPHDPATSNASPACQKEVSRMLLADGKRFKWLAPGWKAAEMSFKEELKAYGYVPEPDELNT